MNDSQDKKMGDPAMLVLGSIQEQCRQTSASVDLVLNEVRNQGVRLGAVEQRLDTVEQQVAEHPPRQRMITLDEIHEPTVRGSIRAIEAETSKSRRENIYLSIAVAVVVPIAVALINQCGPKPVVVQPSAAEQTR